MLISAAMPIMSVYRLPQGQYGYSGHVVNLPQDVASFAQSLPRLPSELDVIVVRKEGANHSHRDFRVRRAVVHRALQWLVTHNQYYHSLGVTIDITALDQLPQNGNISQLVQSEGNLITVTAFTAILENICQTDDVTKAALLTSTPFNATINNNIITSISH